MLYRGKSGTFVSFSSCSLAAWFRYHLTTNDCVYVCRLNERFAHLQLNDLRKEATLGVGGFGRVELVTLADNKSVSYALKVMKKAQIVETRQQQHILNEKQIMLESNCAFIAKLFKTFKGRSPHAGLLGWSWLTATDEQH